MAKPMAILLGAVTLGALASGCDREKDIVGLQPKGLNLSGNWEFSTTSTVPEMPPVTIAGNMAQSGGSLNGVVHVDGSNCFDQQTAIHLTGELADSNISLTSASVAGQIITLTGSVTDTTLAGTYAIHGGCANGDQGNVGGFRVPPISGRWRFNLESRSEEMWIGSAMLTQGSASSEGSFGVTGTAEINLRCFSGTVTAGAFPYPSYIVGRSVVIKIDTGDGTLVFHGTVDQARKQIIGHYQVVGGRCNGEGGRAWLWRFPVG
jgi:hypothetical protein